ncbi:MAG: hypothetical protein E6X99_23060 [Pantoea sp.]|nr:hypothetical protein [Pantoea sp.]
MSKRIVQSFNGRLRSFTSDDLVKGLATALRPVQAQRQKAQDAAFKRGQHIAANRTAGNAISAALRVSNQRAGQSNVKAIDSLFDSPVVNKHAPQNQPLLDAIDDIVPQRAQALDDAIDGITPATKTQSIDKFIDDL